MVAILLLYSCGNNNHRQDAEAKGVEIEAPEIINHNVGYTEYFSSENELYLYNYDDSQKECHTISRLQDVDFDGEEELFIASYRRHKDGGNQYCVYKINGITVQLMDYLPFNNLCGLVAYDYSKKTITLSSKTYLTPNNLTKVVYRSISDTLPANKVYPKTLDNRGRRILEGYYNAHTRPFRLDSLYEWSNDFLYVYANINGEITLMEKRSMKDDELYFNGSYHIR